MRPRAGLLRQAGVRVATAATTLNVEEPGWSTAGLKYGVLRRRHGGGHAVDAAAGVILRSRRKFASHHHSTAKLRPCGWSQVDGAFAANSR